MNWTLLDGLVTLNQLGQRGFWRILLVTPVTMAAIGLMVPRRLSAKRTWAVIGFVYGILWLLFLISHLTVLPSPAAGKIGSVAKGWLEYVALPLFLTRHRDWRIIFLMLTVGTMSFQADTIASLLLRGEAAAPYGSAITALGFGLILAWFVVTQRKAIWDCMERQKRGWAVFSSLPAMMCAVTYLFRCYPDPLALHLQNPVGSLLVVVMFPLLYRLLFHALYTQREQARLEQNAAMLEVQLHVMEEQEQQLERNLREAAVARHDRRHFHQVLLAYLDAGDIDGARTVLLQQLQRKEGRSEIWCADQVLNQMLDHYARWASEEHIRFSAVVKLKGTRVHRRTELLIALCNALENAVQAGRRVAEPKRRHVDAVLVERGEQIFLEVRNAYDGTLLLPPDKRLPLAGREGHGYGLQSIASVAGGTLECTAADGEFTLRALI